MPSNILKDYPWEKKNNIFFNAVTRTQVFLPSYPGQNVPFIGPQKSGSRIQGRFFFSSREWRLLSQRTINSQITLGRSLYEYFEYQRSLYNNTEYVPALEHLITFLIKLKLELVTHMKDLCQKEIWMLPKRTWALSSDHIYQTVESNIENTHLLIKSCINVTVSAHILSMYH